MGPIAQSLTVSAGDRVTRLAAWSMRNTISDLAEETVLAIQAQIPEYCRPADENYHRTVRAGVELALGRFLRILERPSDDNGEWQAVFRALGAGEVREGRSLEALQSAVRIGGRIGCRRLLEFAQEESLPVGLITALTDAIWAHVDALADAAAEGYRQAQGAQRGELDRRRRRLLELLVADPPAGEDAVVAAARTAGWTLPRRVAAVALDPSTVRAVPPVLPPEILADLERSEPALIVPDPDSSAQTRLIATSLSRFPAAVGPAVPPGQAGNSLRWARQAMELARCGVLPGNGLIRCDDHLGTLVIFQDEALLAAIVQRRLAPLARVRESQREVLADTLLASLQHNQNANAVAVSLYLHPQTVRRRLRQLDLLFGDQVQDREARFELEIALRAARARRIWSSGQGTGPIAITATSGRGLPAVRQA